MEMREVARHALAAEATGEIQVPPEPGELAPAAMDRTARTWLLSRCRCETTGRARLARWYPELAESDDHESP